MMEEHAKEYRDSLEKCICQAMKYPAKIGESKCMDDAIRLWEHLGAVVEGNGGHERHHFSDKEAMDWCAKMVNSDGTTGAHWTMDQTTSVAKSIGVKFDHIAPHEWYAAMNMMYSDYCAVARKYGFETPEIMGHLAKAFLFDEDGPGPQEKLSAYYNCIVK